MIVCNLTTLLAERNLTAVKVSKATGISRPTLSALINNTGNGVQYDTINKLCRFLDVTPNELFCYTPYNFLVTALSDLDLNFHFAAGQLKNALKENMSLLIQRKYYFQECGDFAIPILVSPPHTSKAKPYTIVTMLNGDIDLEFYDVENYFEKNTPLTMSININAYTSYYEELDNIKPTIKPLQVLRKPFRSIWNNTPVLIKTQISNDILKQIQTLVTQKLKDEHCIEISEVIADIKIDI